MADKELNLWIERFSRDIGYKSSVIVFGNTADIMLNPKNSGKYFLPSVFINCGFSTVNSCF